MRCRDIDRLVTAYVDGELDERRSSALRGHLRVCEVCAARVEDEAALRKAAGGLEPLEAPSALWSAIDARLAEAEIDDAGRSRIWLWWQRALDGARRFRLPLAVGSAAIAAAVAVWMLRGQDESGPAAQPVVAELQPEVKATGGEPCAAARTHDELVLCQMADADRRYLEAIEELAGLVAEERSSWTPEQAARFDASLAELDRALADELKRVAAAVSASPASRDPLYSIYQAKIDLLSRAAVGGQL
jgi:hypothetical protein